MTEQVSGSAATQENSVPTEQSQQTDKVAYETYKRVLSEAKKLKEQVKQFEEQQNKLQEEKAKAQEAALKEQNQWKALYEQREKEANQLKEVLSKKEEAINNGIKLAAFEKVLGGKIKHEDYYSHVPWDRIIINPETGKVDEESVKMAVPEFTKTHASLIDFQTGKMPNQAPRPVQLAENELKTKEDIRNALKQVLSQNK